MKAVLLLALPLCLTACGGDGNNNDDDTPITDGDWYRPTPMTTWHWQLSGPVNTGYDVDAYDIDLFDTDTAVIQSLQAQNRHVICYFSAGSYEDWREDADDFHASDLGNNLDGWPGERWLDVRSDNVRAIMSARLDLAVQKGCDAVEPDNMDGYTNNPGHNFTIADQLDYNRWLANTAHEKDLAIGLKNDLDQAAQLVDYFDFAVNEECYEYDECDVLSVFIDANKAVFNAEYQSQLVNNPQERAALCADSVSREFSTLILPLDLDDSFRYSCL